MNFSKLISDAQTSGFGKWKLNFLLQRFIPFNKPHGIKILELSSNRVEVLLPYKRKNLNHIKGLHACAMATSAEFASGFLLLSRLGVENYRLIMQSLEVEYFYQGKENAKAIYEITEEDLLNKIIEPLKTQEKVNYSCVIQVEDQSGNHLCTAKSNWQIKSWTKVKLAR